MAHELTTTDSGDIVVVGNDGSTLTDLAQRFGHFINVKDDYGAVGDDSTDDTSAIQAAINAANTANTVVYFPPATYRCTSTLTYAAPMIGHANNRATLSGSVLHFTMTDDSDAIAISIGSAIIKDLMILGQGSSNSCVGIHGIAASANRSVIDNVRVESCSSGISCNGYEIDFYSPNIFTCGVGMLLVDPNGNNIFGGFIETCQNEGLWISGGTAFSVRGCVIEGNNQANGNFPEIRVDNTRGLLISGCYLEATTSNVMLNVGENDSAKTDNVDIVVEGGSLGNGGDTVVLANVTGFSVRGNSFNGRWQIGSNVVNADIPLETWTANAVPVNGALTLSNSVDNNWTKASPHPNLVPDPYFFGGGLRGGSTASFQRVSGAVETTTLGPFASAYRLTVTNASSATQRATLDFPDSVAAHVGGRRLVFGAWVYVPSGQTYVANNSGPKVAVWTEIDVDGGGDNAPAVSNSLELDRWTLIQSLHQIGSGSSYTNFSLNFGTRGTSSGIPAVGEFIIFSGIFCNLAEKVDLARMGYGPYYLDPIVGIDMPNRRIAIGGTAAPTDSDLTFLAGDQVLDTTPSSSGTIGWVCTSGGSPGTWNTFGSIS